MSIFNDRDDNIRESSLPLVNPADIGYFMDPEYRLRCIIYAFSQVSLSKNMASVLVGGRGRLMRLVQEGKIHVSKPSNTQNGKWYCNGAEVVENILYRL